jgi:hypothetical protein
MACRWSARAPLVLDPSNVVAPVCAAGGAARTFVPSSRLPFTTAVIAW